MKKKLLTLILAGVVALGGVAQAQQGSLAFQGNTIGVTDAVPPPWTPVTVSRNSVQLWGKELVTSENGVLDSLRILGEEVLAGPIQVTVGEQNWSAATGKSQEWGKASPAAVFVEKRGTLKNVTVEHAVTVEYDGYVAVTTRIQPASGAVQVDGLAIEIPVKKSVAQLGSHYFLGQELPYRVKQVFGASQEYKGFALSGRDFALPFTPAVFIGNAEKGVQWFSEDGSNWVLDNPQRAIEVLVRGDAVVLKVNLISRPVTLTKPLTFAWGLNLLPSKPFPNLAERLPLQTAQEESTEPIVANWLGSGGGRGNRLDEAVQQGLKTILIHQKWTDMPGYPGTTSAQKASDLRTVINEAHRRNLKVVVYVGRDMPAESPEGRQMLDAMIRLPQQDRKRRGKTRYQSYNVDANKNYNDFLVYRAKMLIDEYGIDGLMLDGHNMVIPCSNTQHGHGVHSAGGVVPTYPLADARDLMKRLYHLFHVYKKDGILIAHAESPFLPALTFCDLRWVGEGAVWRWRNQFTRQEDRPIVDLLPLDEFRAIYAGYNIGVPTIFLSKPRVGGMLSKDRVAALSLIHGSIPRFRWPALSCPKQCDEQDIACHSVYARWLNMSRGGDDWVFVPYWGNTGPFRLEDESKAKLSYHLNEKDRKALVYVSNFAPTEAKCTIRTTGGKLRETRPVTGAEPRVDRSGRMDLTIASYGYAVFEVTY